MSRSSFEVEEEFDPASLGLVEPVAAVPPKQLPPTTTPPPARPTQRLQPRLSSSGKYESADWFPGESMKATTVTEHPAGRFTSSAYTAKDALDALLASAGHLRSANVLNGHAQPSDGSRLAPVDTPAKGESPDRPAKSPIAIATSTLSPATHKVRDLGESYDSGLQTELVSDTDASIGPPRVRAPTPKTPNAGVRFGVVRLKGKRVHRPSVRVRKPIASVTGSEKADPDVKEHDFALDEPQPVHYDSQYQEELASKFGHAAVDTLHENARADANAGVKLPPPARDLLTAMGDLITAVKMANEVRRELDAPLLSYQTDRVALRKSVASLQTKLYTDIAAALVLPSAPTPLRKLWTGDKTDGKPKVQMTPSSLAILQRELPNYFKQDRATLQAFFASGKRAAYGEENNHVLWDKGIGSMSGEGGVGFRKHAVYPDSLVHVFVDHSNILYGLITCLQTEPAASLPPRHLRTLSLPCLSLLLRRGRHTPPGSLHLVASSPLKQDLDPLVRLGWEVSIMKRVEVTDSEVIDPMAASAIAQPQQRANGGAYNELLPRIKRFREQGVDELLHLKILQALNTKPVPAPKGSTIVLATGDAAGGQFNRDGFLGTVKEAIKRGWTVELWSWRSGMSRHWVDTAKRENWQSSFSIHKLDRWAKELVEETEEEVD